MGFNSGFKGLNELLGEEKLVWSYLLIWQKKTSPLCIYCVLIFIILRLTLCNTSFKNSEILRSACLYIYVFCMVLRTNSNYFCIQH